MHAAQARAAIRDGAHRGTTAGLAPNFVQTNLIVVPTEWADDVAQLCARNPVPCPLVDRTEPGSVTTRVAGGADLRTDIPGYRLWENGELVGRRTDARAWWRDDLVAFLIGCSFTFEKALVRAGLAPRHLAAGTTVPMYRTNVPLASAGRLHGRMVVSMRPYPAHEIDRVRAVTRPFVQGHGEPFWAGDPAVLGITDLNAPDEGDPVEVAPGEVPVFWGCGVTPQLVAIESRLPYAITHEPGMMFITDLPAGGQLSPK